MGTQCRVAVIEDDPDIRELLVEVLSDSDIGVDAAEHPAALSPSWSGDAIITDGFTLPYRRANARELVRRLRERFGVPVVILTGQPEAVKDARELGAVAVITKPFDIGDLVATVRRVACGRSAVAVC